MTTVEPDPVNTEEYLEKMASLQVNEAGKVMILMYHVIGAPKEADWVQTAPNFRRDLENLYQDGYTLISLRDLVQNNIKVPAGRTPLVLTFDDGSEGQFRYLLDQNGQKRIDPDSAVGILLGFAEEHPDFGYTATFFINDRPFGQKEYWQEKLAELVKLGFDIGNHGLTHPYLNRISDEAVQKELAGLARVVEEAVPGYRVDSLALPFGLSPKNPALAVQGTYQDYSYQHLAVLKVGANPAQSPVATGFDPLRLPRVQGSSVELGKWLEYFRKNPREKYISDGDPETVTLPLNAAELVDQARLKDKKLVILP